MNAKEMLQVIDGRREMANSIYAKLDFMYDQTQKMLKAIEEGKDKDRCFEYWVSLIDKMETESEADKAYYNYHITRLVELIEEWYKAFKQMPIN